jgi:hypothetical protein
MYTQGALTARQVSNFAGLQSLPSLHNVYRSKSLFPVFRNRVLSANRPEYASFLNWLNLPEKLDDPVAILSLTGGKKETDTLEIFPKPRPDADGNCSVRFFVHGIRHIEGAEAEVQKLIAGDRLLLVPEPENKYDKLALRLEKSGHVLGYCPRYLNADFNRLLELTPDSCVVRVERVNPHPIPIQFRLLCHFSAAWPAGFEPFAYDEYKPLRSDDDPDRLCPPAKCGAC